MKGNEMLYPEFRRYPVYWMAIAERRDVVVNDYMDTELLEEKENELRDNPVIMLRERAARIMECGPAALAYGESFGKNVRNLFPHSSRMRSYTLPCLGNRGNTGMDYLTVAYTEMKKAFTRWKSLSWANGRKKCSAAERTAYRQRTYTATRLSRSMNRHTA